MLCGSSTFPFMIMFCVSNKTCLDIMILFDVVSNRVCLNILLTSFLVGVHSKEAFTRRMLCESVSMILAVMVLQDLKGIMELKEEGPSSLILSCAFSNKLSSRLPSLLFLLQDSCKFCLSRFQGEGVALKFLSCLNRQLSIQEQLSFLESAFHLLEKRTGRCQEGSAVCIVHHTRNILSSIVAFCSLPLQEGLCDYNHHIVNVFV
ncbi:hypothetical protein RJT34_18660 [Clitoria ternatea]|uniref:Uncharacterized protein n=1 Tax=Clitoria ternatea TaxID=43366 RepID=A0AAN9JBI8_CLITE